MVNGGLEACSRLQWVQIPYHGGGRGRGGLLRLVCCVRGWRGRIRVSLYRSKVCRRVRRSWRTHLYCSTTYCCHWSVSVRCLLPLLLLTQLIPVYFQFVYGKSRRSDRTVTERENETKMLQRCFMFWNEVLRKERMSLLVNTGRTEFPRVHLTLFYLRGVSTNSWQRIHFSFKVNVCTQTEKYHSKSRGNSVDGIVMF